MLRSDKVLGLCIGQQWLRAAELRAAGDRPEILRLAQLELTDQLSLKDPAKFGHALAQFLRKNGFSARRAVIGIPASQLLVQPRQLPPAPEPAAAGILRLAAERDFPSDLRRMEFDFLGHTDPAKSSSVLLVGTSREFLDRLIAAADAAKLKLIAVTAQAIAMSAATGGNAPNADARVLCVTSGESELVMQHQGAPRLVRHLPTPPDEPADTSADTSTDAWADAWAGELRRAMSMAGTIHPNGNSTPLQIWDTTGRSKTAWSRLADRLGMSIATESDLAALGVSGPPASADGAPAADGTLAVYAPAVAVARAALTGRIHPDFIHSRLALPRQHIVGRRAAWAAILVVVLSLAGTYMWHDLSSLNRQVAQVQASIDSRRDEVKAADALATNVKQANGWFENRPPALDCLRDLTLAMPPDGSAWATSFVFNDSGAGRLGGKAVDGFDVLRILDPLNANKHFSNVSASSQPLEVRGVRQISFTISFTYSAGD